MQQWLERNVPGKQDKVLNRIRAIRGGKLNDPRFGARMRGEGIFAGQISQMFHVARRKADSRRMDLSTGVCGLGRAAIDYRLVKTLL
jgi:hypothetical protein